MTKRCIELLRVSTAGQAATDKASIPAQRAVNRQTAQAYGLTIVKTIELSDVSGAQVLLAPEIQEMLRLMNDPEIHGVIVREFSRLMRPENFGDYAMLQAFVESSTLLYLPDGPIDFASDTGMLTGTMRAVMGGMERRELVKKMWRIKEQRRKDGGFSQSKLCLPFGVSYSAGGWRYTAESQRVREAFRILLAGTTSYEEIGRAVGIAAFNLRNILRNPIYTGWRVIDQRRDPSPRAKKAGKDGRQADRPKIQRAPEEVIRVQVIKDPLVSESDFNRVQQILDLKRKHFQRLNSGPHRFTYNGFLLCGDCRALLYSRFRGDDYYTCKSRCGAPYQRRDTLDSLLDKLFTKRLTSPSFLKRHILAPLAKTKPSEDDSGALRTQLTALEGKRERVLSAFFDGIISVAERETRLSAILVETRAIQGMLARCKPTPTLSVETLAQAFAPFVEFDLLNRDDKRQLLNTLTPEIVVSRYEVKGMFIGIDQRHTAADYLPAVNQNNTPIRYWVELKAA